MRKKFNFFFFSKTKLLINVPTTHYFDISCRISVLCRWVDGGGPSVYHSFAYTDRSNLSVRINNCVIYSNGCIETIVVMSNLLTRLSTPPGVILSQKFTKIKDVHEVSVY